MTVSRSNPISIQVLDAEVAIEPEALKKQVSELIAAIRATDEELLGWLRKQAELIKLRLGDRRPRNVPWKGASNISVPLIDGIIRRWRPGVASLVLDADPVAFFTAQTADDFDPARLAEQFFTYLLLTYMDVTYPTVQLVDLVAWRGHAYVREAWKYETVREARVVTIKHLFPNGVNETIQASQQAASQQGQEPPAPEDIVMTALEQEYQLDRSDEAEGGMLLVATQKILQGAEYIKIVYRRVRTDRPDWQPIDPINVIVPQNQDPGNAEFFCIIHHKTKDDLRGMAIDQHLDPAAVQELLDSGNVAEDGTGGTKSADGQRIIIRDIMDRRAGKRASGKVRHTTNTIPVWEIYCRLDLNGDGERERAILWYAPTIEKPLALLDFPYPFDNWPVTFFPFEACPRPIDNRGIADMLRPLQKIVNAYHNARIDAAQIVLAPVLLMRVAGGNYQKSIKWHPGSVIPVGNINDIAPLQQNLAILNGLLQEEQVNQRLAETYVGVFDATLTNLQQRGERRTAAEVNAIQGISSNIFGLDAKIFQVALSQSFTKLWQLWVDLGPAEVFFRVTGEDLPKISTKAEIVRNYDIRAAGTPANTNRSFQISAYERIMSNPLTLPLAQQGRVNAGALFDGWVKLIDFNLAKRVMIPAEESQVVKSVIDAAQIADQQAGGEGAPGLI